MTVQFSVWHSHISEQDVLMVNACFVVACFVVALCSCIPTACDSTDLKRSPANRLDCFVGQQFSSLLIKKEEDDLGPMMSVKENVVYMSVCKTLHRI